MNLKVREGVGLWFLAGNFNAVRSTNERRGRASEGFTGRREIEEFNECIGRLEM